MLALIVVLSVLTREHVVRVARVVMAFSFILVLVPLIDFVVSQGRGFVVSYVKSPEAFIYEFTGFLGLLHSSILTPGQQVAVLATLVLGVYYIVLKIHEVSSAIWRVVGFLVFVWWFGVMMGSIPLVAGLLLTYDVAAVKPANIEYMLRVLAVMLTLLLILLFYLYSPRKFVAVFSGLKYTRMFHYLAAMVLGVLAFHLTVPDAPISLNAVVISALGLVSAYVFGLTVNNIYDGELWRYVSHKDAFGIAVCTLMLAIMFSFLVNYGVFVTMVSMLALAFMYSAPPVSFKRLGAFNNVVIGLITLLVFWYGFLIHSTSLCYLPAVFSIGVFLTFSLGATVKDLKDVHRDKRAGVKTLPVLLGEASGTRVTAALCSLAFLVLPVMLGMGHMAVVAMVFGVVNYTMLVRSRDERWCFGLYFVFFLLFAFSLLSAPKPAPIQSCF